MYQIYSTIKERLARYLLAESYLTADLTAGSKIIHLDDNINSFEFEALNSIYPQILLMDADSSGEKTPNGYSGCSLMTSYVVDPTTRTMQLTDPVNRNWNTSKKALIRRAPGGIPIMDVKIGHLSVIAKYPTVCIVPASKAIEWVTLNSTKDVVSIDIIIYLQNGDTEQATIDSLKITDVIEWMLMSNLHLPLEGEVKPYEVTSYAMVKNIDYGVIQKGNEFLKATKLTWEGEVHVLRDYLYGRLPYGRKSDTI